MGFATKNSRLFFAFHKKQPANSQVQYVAVTRLKHLDFLSLPITAPQVGVGQ